jgi:predicted metalloprotease with PDZ domain
VATALRLACFFSQTRRVVEAVQSWLKTSAAILMTWRREARKRHKNLVIEAAKLFNSHHHDHYHFPFSLSDTVGGKGLEHHQFSEDGTRANYFTDWTPGV